MDVRRKSPSLMVTSTAICAALYAAGSYATGFITSPWGSGQFRPAVVIPGIFAVIFGPLPAGIGAAIGTLLADSVRRGQLYIPSLVAAVPANFVGFYLFGKMVEGRFNWRRFIIASNVTLILANLLVSFLYWYYNLFVVRLFPADAVDWVFLSLGFTLWFFVTMLPFMLLLGPPLLRAVALAIPSVVPEDVMKSSLREEFSDESLAFSLAIPGVVILLIGLGVVSFPDVARRLSVGMGRNAPVTMELIKLMLFAGGGVLTVLGAAFAVGSRPRRPPPPAMT